MVSKRYALYVTILLALSGTGCSDDPNPRGMTLQTSPHKGDKELKTLRTLCSLRGDAICGEYIKEAASQGQEEKFTGRDEVWFGTPREIPESSRMH